MISKTIGFRGILTIQWPCQEPIDWRYRFHMFLAYFLGLNFRGDTPQNMAKNMVRLRTSINWILEFPLN